MGDHPLIVLRSDPSSHFTTAIAANGGLEHETLTMPGKQASRGDIVGVSLWATDNLNWVLWFWSRPINCAGKPIYEIYPQKTATAGLCGATTIGTNGWVVEDDMYNDYNVYTVSGTGSDQTRKIFDTAANAGNGQLTVAPDWDTNPDGTTVFRVLNHGAMIDKVALNAADSRNFGGSDTLYRHTWSNFDIGYWNDNRKFEIYVSVENRDGSTPKTAYAAGGRMQVELHFRPHR